MSIHRLSIVISAVMVGALLPAQAQTNTFPASGNVGIGTTSPASLLDVAQDSTNAIVWPLQLDNGGYDAGVGQGAGIKFRTSYYGDPNSWSGITGVSEGDYGTKAGIAFWSYKYGTGAAELMRISNLGLVGIGTTGPNNRLDVATGAATGYGNYVQIRTSGSVAFAGGLLLTNNPATTTGWSSLKITTSYNSGNGANAKIGFVLNSDTETFLNSGPAIELHYNGEVILAQGSGNVGIGTANPDQKLTVNGTVHAKEVIVDTGWSDYVFDPDYHLPPLSEVERHVKEQRHLPGIPSAQEVAEHGVSMGQMQAKLLAKVEELTLYTLQLKNENDALKARVAALENR